MNKPQLKSLMLGLALCFAGTSAQAGNFENDVNAAIDDGLAYARSNNYFTRFTGGNGLTLLTLLEQNRSPAGYAGLSADDKTLADSSACLLMMNLNYGGRIRFYSFYDGQTLMALAVYAKTGGPDTPAACPSQSIRATIDRLVDRSIAAQALSDACTSYWAYTGPGCESSTTQYTAAGLAGAKTYYTDLGDSIPARLPGIITALDKISADYAANGKATTGTIWNACGPVGPYPAGCLSHARQESYGSPGSNQQTASAIWLQLLGTRKTVNDPSIQGYLRWDRNAYNYNNITAGDSWPGPSYFYYLWSSAKTYILMDAMPVATGNIGPSDMGTLPALSSGGYQRVANRSPVLDTRPAPRGPGAVGYYAAATPGWYYDYAYRLMGFQNPAGLFPNPNGSWGYPAVDHAYALLVLERAVGGIVIASKCDTDHDRKTTLLDVKTCIPLLP